MYLLYCKTFLLLLWWDAGKVRDRFGGTRWFKGGLRCKGWVLQCNYKCNYINLITDVITYRYFKIYISTM